MPNKTMYILTFRSSNHTSRSFPRRCTFNNVEVCMTVINCIIVSAWVILETIWLLILRRVVNKDWHIQTMGYYAAVKMKRKTPMNWTDLDDFQDMLLNLKSKCESTSIVHFPHVKKRENMKIYLLACARETQTWWETRQSTDLEEWKGVKGKGMIME